MGSSRTKVAEAIAVFCRDHGADTAFVVAGGASLHLIHAFADVPGCRYVAMHHEQSAAMAADAFSRSTDRVGLAVATSGPGAMNLITGIAGAYYDSIAALFITGQVSTSRMTGETGVRQIGFQETPITSMVERIAKAAIQVTHADQIRHALEFAFWAMTEGRPGPVLIDVPDDIQRQEIDWDRLKGFSPPAHAPSAITEADLAQLQAYVDASQRPVLVAGAGVRIANAEREFLEFADRLGVPVLLTWGVVDVLPGNHPLRLGVFGTHGRRSANFAIQNADLVLSIGSRLDTKATGSPVPSFARGATKVVVDIDSAELRKFASFGLSIDVPIRSDAKDFLRRAACLRPPEAGIADWLTRIDGFRSELDGFDDALRVGPGLNPYRFLARLQSTSPRHLDIYTDTGCVLAWLMQVYLPRSDQRIFHDLNNTAMGWSLPATIGGKTGNPGRMSLCLVGDGSLMMSVQDLTTMASLDPQARIILVDNDGYSMIRQTQDQWLGGQYVASSTEGGLHFPDFSLLARSAGFSYSEVSEDAHADDVLEAFWVDEGPKLLRVVVSPEWRVIPQVTFGRPNEDMDPLLPRDVFEAHMIIEPLDVSRSVDEGLTR